MATFDVAVVGAGMIGSSAALALAEAGRRTILVGPGEPANKAATDGPLASHYDEGRITRIVDPDPLWAKWAAESIARYGAIEERSGIGFHTACGSIRAAPAGAASIERAKAAAAPYGVALEEIDGAELRRRCPAVGLGDQFTVLWEHGPAGYVNPRRMVAAIRTAATRSGVTLAPEAALSARSAGKDAEILLSGGDRISCARALVTVGPHALDPSLLPVLPDLKPVGRTVVQIEVNAGDPAFAGLPSFIVAFDADEANYSFYGVPPVAYPGGGLWLKTGNGGFGDLLEGSDTVRDWFAAGGSRAEANAIRERTLQMFPGLANARWRTEPCALVETDSERPFIGRVPGNPAIGVALGCNGYAAKSCIAVGRVAADMIVDDGWADADAAALSPRWRAR